MSTLVNTTTLMYAVPNTTTNGILKIAFDAVDYTVFSLMLAISAAIGLYFGFFAKGNNTTEEYLHGGKKMKTLPIAISLVASQISGVSIMTIPAEVYTFGINIIFTVFPMLVVIPVLVWVVIPVFYNNNISNCYEYLEMRFNRKTRELQTVAFMGTVYLLLPIFTFVPALAFSQVSGLNIHLINGVVCAICVFYTMFGGIKAVVWTDVIQGAIMMVSVVLVGTLGVYKVGGLGEVFNIAQNGMRLQPDFTFDATTRSTLWNNFISSMIMWTSYVGLNQSCVQRIVSLPSLKQAKISLIIFGIGFMFIMSFNIFAGIVMYARYHQCDPLTFGFVSKADKMLPYFVQDVAGHLKGMPGIFISCVFSAALSTMSAGMNSMAGVVYFSYIKPYIQHSEHRANLIMKTFVFLTGIYCIAAGFLVEKFGSILQIGYSIGGVTFGSIFGVFLLGMLVPRAHGRAAFWSTVSSIIIMLIIVVISKGRVSYKPLPLSVEGCQVLNGTVESFKFAMTTKIPLPPTPPMDKSFNILDMSFNWYSVFGTIVFFVLAIPLSYLLPAEKGTNIVKRKLLSPIVQPLVKYELTQTEDNELTGKI